jgi:hypothetical protein
MKARKPVDRHSDQGPSSKDWVGGGSERQGRQDEVQPGTAHEGKSWQSRRPDPDDEDDKLEGALEDSFPASDPPAPTQPMSTGWEAVDKEKKSPTKK